MIEELQPVAYPLVNRFFKANGHKGKARSDERVFVFKHEGRIVAALRAFPKANGYLLRSVWVDIALREQGLGLQLTRNAVQALQPSSCWCYPYAHLRHFYIKAGLIERQPFEVPESISQPWKNYQSKGNTFLLMGTPNEEP